MIDNQRDITIDAVHPAPSAEEAAAIVAALRRLSDTRAKPEEREPSRWRLAARWEGLHRVLDAGPEGWRIAARLEP